MPRIRSIHYNACKSEKLQAASAEAERCYWRLLPHCDDEGRAEDDTRNLRSEMFPIAEPPLPAATVDAWLEELHELGLIVRYTVDGKRYLVVTQWHDYQKPQHAKESILPPPPPEGAQPHEEERPPREDDDETSPVVVVVEGGGEVEVVGVGGAELALVSPPATDPVVAIFDAWREHTHHRNATLNPDRRKIIRKAMQHYPDDDLIDACRGVHLSPHHRGENDRRTVYDDISLVLRDSKNIEFFRDLARGEGGASPPKLPANAESVRLAVQAVEASQ